MSEPSEPSYFVESRWGDAEAEPPRWRMKQILERLDEADAEHIDPWLTHESGWTLAVNAHGEVVWANEEARFAPRHRLAVIPAEMLRLWCALAAGELDALEAEPWEFGLPAPRQPSPTPRKDQLTRRLLAASLVVGLSWSALALVLPGKLGVLGKGASVWVFLANAWLPPLFVGLLLTAMVRAAVGGRRDRERRIARACAVLAAALGLAFVLVVNGYPELELDYFSMRWIMVLPPPLLLTAALIALVAGLCVVSPPLIVALFAAERAKRADERR